MTVDSMAAQIVREAMKPPRKPKPLRCVYCTIVVGESTWYKDDMHEPVEDWEPYAEMPEGAVCWNCVKHYDRVQAATKQDKDNAPRRQVAVRMRRGQKQWQNPYAETPEEQAARIRELYAEGMSQEAIGKIIGISSTTVQRRMAKFGIATRWSRWGERTPPA